MVVKLIHVADAISLMTGVGAGMDGLNYNLSQETVDSLRVRNRVMEMVACETISSLDEVRKVFSGGNGNQNNVSNNSNVGRDQNVS